ncbi:rox3 mediator complex subunit domain-containing protein [Sarocladium implicatum]|nr:rox3 mediator complex subunit domain-containing protein [Sarocladium implicatum]
MSFHPHTPQSPSQNSPGTSSETIASLATSTSTMATTPALPTPAHSVNGISQHDVVMTEDTPQKRKRSIDDTGDRDQKKMFLEEYKLGIDDLHRDVGQKYLLCQAPHVASRPDTASDLYRAYGLTDLAAEVAREKPNGEKNALRKTYKGHIKRLGVAGHFNHQETPSGFFAMLQVPDHEWGVLQVKGREITDGLSPDTLSSLSKAVTMVQGSIPRSRWDTSVLGELAPNGDPSKQSTSGKLTTPNTPTMSTISTNPGNRSLPKSILGQDPARPKRNIKKRGYGDSSFEGYNETFQDEDGYDTGEGEGGQKRRKKNSDSTSPLPGAVRQQSYGPGMVGA